MKYQVTVSPVEDTEAGAFVSLPGDVQIELIEATETTEIYTIETDRDIERLLDTSDGVISYTVEADEETHPTDEEIDEELRQLADDEPMDDYPETEQEANHL